MTSRLWCEHDFNYKLNVDLSCRKREDTWQSRNRGKDQNFRRYNRDNWVLERSVTCISWSVSRLLPLLQSVCQRHQGFNVYETIPLGEPPLPDHEGHMGKVLLQRHVISRATRGLVKPGIGQ